MISEAGRTGRRPEAAAAIVNGLLVLVTPPGLLLGGSVFLRDSEAVRPDGASVLLPAILTGLQMVPKLVPWAALAAWRTWVHARRWREHRGSGWQGVAEAGACGFAVALKILAHGILSRPAEAAPFVIAYGGPALILGLAAGLMLRGTALLVLKQTAQDA
jgi:hypothetical protein